MQTTVEYKVKYNRVPEADYGSCANYISFVFLNGFTVPKFATVEPEGCSIMSYNNTEKISEGYYCAESYETLSIYKTRGYCSKYIFSPDSHENFFCHLYTFLQ